MSKPRDWKSQPPTSPEDLAQFLNETMIGMARAKRERPEGYDILVEEATGYAQRQLQIPDSRARALYVRMTNEGHPDHMDARFRLAFAVFAREVLAAEGWLDDLPGENGTDQAPPEGSPPAR